MTANGNIVVAVGKDNPRAVPAIGKHIQGATSRAAKIVAIPCLASFPYFSYILTRDEGPF